MEQALDRGVPPERVAFVSFTRAAVREARERITERFGLAPDALPWVRTLHSLVFRLLGLRRGDVFGREDLKRLAELTGEELTGHQDLDAPTIGERGDALLFLDQTARARQVALEVEWRRHGGEVGWFRLLRFVEAYRGLRLDLGKLDFTDLFEAYCGVGEHLIDNECAGTPAPVDVAILDEAQDLTPLGWRAAEMAFGDASEFYVAADDDQCIYSWAGADTEPLLRFEGSREVLAESYRLPRKVHALATRVSGRIRRRNKKLFAPRDTDGLIKWHADPGHVDLRTGKWLLMARTRRQLGELATLARDQGCHYALMGEAVADPALVQLILEWEALRRGTTISYGAVARLRLARVLPKGAEPQQEYVTAAELGIPGTLPPWFDAFRHVARPEREFLRACLRRGEKLTQPPRVRVSTIHGAKGAEADRVLLVTDLPGRVWRGAELDPDAEGRVCYVGVTRAREELHVVLPRGQRGYEL
jgi:ATP-dependent DNA helicase UvrD/PcrA